MDSFFSFYILGIPGVLTYLIYKSMEDSTSKQRSNLELLAITSLLWIPTIFLSILLFNTIHLLIDYVLITMDISFFEKLNIIKVTTVESLIENINKFIFILFFTLTTGASSIVVSFLAPNLIEKLINLVNGIRAKKGYAKITPKGSSTWKLFFTVNKEHQKNSYKDEYPIVVQISYLDDPNNLIYGCLKIVSNDGKQQKEFVIEAEDEWTTFIKKYQMVIDTKIPFADVFFDATNKLVIREINQAELNQKMEEWKNERKQNKQNKQGK